MSEAKIEAAGAGLRFDARVRFKVDPERVNPVAAYLVRPDGTYGVVMVSEQEATTLVWGKLRAMREEAGDARVVGVDPGVVRPDEREPGR